ncbi:unnamed protein product [Caenorhabditis auriculariae]|uniref:Uncharacterized protein n=1 Tax=Caenorhabditis auriculariae TaxID=2777116 RepID=A0A8S1H6I1_9PELO|nr:unnamed protein product [Caenorhabditis auriculariae]
MKRSFGPLKFPHFPIPKKHRSEAPPLVWGSEQNHLVLIGPVVFLTLSQGRSEEGEPQKTELRNPTCYPIKEENLEDRSTRDESDENEERDAGEQNRPEEEDVLQDHSTSDESVESNETDEGNETDESEPNQPEEGEDAPQEGSSSNQSEGHGNRSSEAVLPREKNFFGDKFQLEIRYANGPLVGKAVEDRGQGERGVRFSATQPGRARSSTEDLPSTSREVLENSVLLDGNLREETSTSAPDEDLNGVMARGDGLHSALMHNESIVDGSDISSGMAVAPPTQAQPSGLIPEQELEKFMQEAVEGFRRRIGLQKRRKEGPGSSGYSEQSIQDENEEDHMMSNGPRQEVPARAANTDAGSALLRAAECPRCGSCLEDYVKGFLAGHSMGEQRHQMATFSNQAQVAAPGFLAGLSMGELGHQRATYHNQAPETAAPDQVYQGTLVSAQPVQFFFAVPPGPIQADPANFDEPQDAV